MTTLTLHSKKKSDLKIFADMAKKLNISAEYSDTPEIEEVEDWELLAEMQRAMDSGLADTSSVLKKLGLNRAGIKANAN